jgi:hypothetical protein
MAQAGGGSSLKPAPAVIAAQIRRALKEGGSAEHAQGVQRFFQYDAKRTVAYLMKIRGRASRWVLRTGCETLPATVRQQVLFSEQSSAKTKLFESNL